MVQIRPFLCMVLMVYMCLNSSKNFAISDTLNHQKKEYKATILGLKQGLTYTARNQNDSAMIIIHQALVQAEKHQFKDLIPLIYVELSRLSGLVEDADDQHLYLSKARIYFEQDTMHTYIDEYYSAMARFHFSKNENDQALDYLRKTEIVRNRVAPFKNWKTYALFAKIYRNMNDNRKAELFSEKAEALARLQNVTRILTELEEDFATGEKNVKINELILQNKIIQMEVNGSRKQKMFLIGGLALAAIILALLSLILFQRSKNNKLLKEKNLMISKNLEEKEMLIKEIHHRVKNNLQLISSLLSLQSRSVTDNVASSALAEGQNRVLAMALIHQNLYKDNISSGMEVKDYVTQLTEKLLNTYQTDRDKIKLELDIDHIALDVSTLVPIGLIINELITNAIKYAFKEGQDGKLKVSFKQIDDHLMLSVTDNGDGIKAEDKSKGFGMRLIEVLSKKLEADLNIFNNEGTTVQLEIKNYKTAI
ncbi:MAG: sensor histidine kinase [Saprospiraceae bacterium]|nr:sensor histidine kinase [Saprospiraceae bacterium]